MSADEFALIERFFNRPVADPDVVVAIGDDAAVVKTHGSLAVAVDTVVAGVHFPVHTPAKAVGHRALAVNLSDLAAMGATPRWCTLALTVPEVDEGWLAGFADGFFALGAVHGITLVGGDLTRGPLTVSVQVIGSVADSGALTRGGARSGDWLFVTGTLGDSAAGLKIITAGSAGDDPSPLAERFLWPEPRVAAGQALNGVAAACIDVSDGLLADLGHLCDASACRGVVELEQLPLSAALQATLPLDEARQLALSGGDDYELLFTVSGEVDTNQLTRRLGLPVTCIGRLGTGSGTVVRLNGKPLAVTRGGYSHF